MLRQRVSERLHRLRQRQLGLGPGEPLHLRLHLRLEALLRRRQLRLPARLSISDTDAARRDPEQSDVRGRRGFALRRLWFRPAAGGRRGGWGGGPSGRDVPLGKRHREGALRGHLHEDEAAQAPDRAVLALLLGREYERRHQLHLAVRAADRAGRAHGHRRAGESLAREQRDDRHERLDARPARSAVLLRRGVAGFGGDHDTRSERWLGSGRSRLGQRHRPGQEQDADPVGRGRPRARGSGAVGRADAGSRACRRGLRLQWAAGRALADERAGAGVCGDARSGVGRRTHRPCRLHGVLHGAVRRGGVHPPSSTWSCFATDLGHDFCAR